MIPSLLRFNTDAQLAISRTQNFIAEQYAFDFDPEIQKIASSMLQKLPDGIRSRFLVSDKKGYIFFDCQEWGLHKEVIIPLTNRVEEKSLFFNKIHSRSMLALTPIGVKFVTEETSGVGVSYKIKSISSESDLSHFNTSFASLKKRILEVSSAAKFISLNATS